MKKNAIRIIAAPLLIFVLLTTNGCRPPNSEPAKNTNTGRRLWLQTQKISRYIDTNGLAVDRDGNSYADVVATDSGKPSLIKYNSRGQKQWQSLFNFAVPGDSLINRSLVTDGAGNLYVNGLDLRQDVNPRPVKLVKISPDEQIIWQVEKDEWNTFVLDDAGNAYMAEGNPAAAHYPPEGQADVSKYDPNGRLLWTVKNTGRWLEDLAVFGMATDQTGDLYVIHRDKLVKYAAGKKQWSVDSSGSLGGLTVGGGGVYVMPRSRRAEVEGRPEEHGYMIAKYDPEGRLKWTRKGQRPLVPQALVADPRGNVYIVGQWGGSNLWAKKNLAVAKYGPDGKRLWLQRYGPNGRVNIKPAGSVVLDKRGHLHIGATVGGSAPDEYPGSPTYRFLALELDDSGNIMLNQSLGPQKVYEGEGQLLFTNVAADEVGHTYISSRSEATTEGPMFFLAKFAAK